ncbi:DUF2169 domain-containing protein [Nannocystis pusilla]|uniref:DUF2169 domain-containing protein n=1 Tax=Nannocystis pusilla TaxID=889268 RepID=UPI003B7BCBFD
MRALGGSPPPVGFGPVAPQWQPRLGLAGTYDSQWMEQRAPVAGRSRPALLQRRRPRPGGHARARRRRTRTPRGREPRRADRVSPAPPAPARHPSAPARPPGPGHGPRRGRPGDRGPPLHPVLADLLRHRGRLARARGCPRPRPRIMGGPMNAPGLALMRVGLGTPLGLTAPTTLAARARASCASPRRPTRTATASRSAPRG